jgi:hypothetical protein
MNSQEKDFHVANHKQAAEHSAAMAKSHKDAADCHSAMSKACELTEPAMSKKLAEVAECHQSAANACVQNGAFHVSAFEKISKMPTNETRESGVDDIKSLISDLRKLTIPTGISAIPTHDRVVIRNGQPNRDAEKAAVDETLRPLIFDEKQARG